MSYLLIAYFIFLFGYFIYSVAGIYHLWRFGYSGDLSKIMIIIYTIISIAVITISLSLIVLNTIER